MLLVMQPKPLPSPNRWFSIKLHIIHDLFTRVILSFVKRQEVMKLKYDKYNDHVELWSNWENMFDQE